jgi:hypothetical protein
METGFLAGLARVMAKTLFVSGRVNQVRLAWLSVLAGLCSDKAKTSPRAVLALSLNLDWVS